MLTASAWLLFALFYAAALASYWRYRLSGNRAAFWMAVPFAYGAILYLYIVSPAFVLLPARYMVRVLFVMLVLPHLLESVDAIIDHKSDGA